MDCPRCQSRKVRRSHRRGWWEHLASTVYLFPLRCENCGARFFRWLSAEAQRALGE